MTTLFIHDVEKATASFQVFPAGDCYCAFAAMKLEAVDASGAVVELTLAANSGTALYDRFAWKASAPEAMKGEAL